MFHKKNILNRMMSLGLLASLCFVALLSLAQTDKALAATNPPLGLTATFGVLSSTYTNTAGGTTINGDLGYTTGPATAPTVSGTIYTDVLNLPVYPNAGIDQGTALAFLNTDISNACTFTFAPGAIDLATDTTHGTAGQYTAGVYCVIGAASIGTGGITLNGPGTFIFRSTGALDTAANSTVTLATGGPSACDVWWTPGGATTLGANSTFSGTVIDAAGITIGSTVTWGGRALAFGGTVSTTGDTITVPTCALAAVPTITKVFFPATIAAGDTSTITFTLANASGAPISGSFTDTFPGGMTVSVTGPAGGTCAGASGNSLTAGDTSLNITGLTIPAIGSCTVTVVVTTSVLGSNSNFTSEPTSNTAILNVVAAGTAAPTISKSLSASTITVGGTSTIIFTLSNTNAFIVTGANFTDTLVNMSISGAQTAGGTCAGAGTNSFINGQTGLIIFTGLSIPANGSCTVRVVVTSTQTGLHPNTASGVASDNAPIGPVSNTVILNATATPIPTLNEWGMIFFLVLAGLGSVYYLRRSRRS